MSNQTIRLKYDRQRFEENVTLNELIDSENGKLSGMRDLLAHFMTDEAGNYLDETAAKESLGVFTVKQIRDISKQFREAIDNDAIPLTNDASSS